MGKFLMFILVVAAIGYGLTVFSESDSAKNSVMGSFENDSIVKTVKKGRAATQGSLDQALDVNKY